MFYSPIILPFLPSLSLWASDLLFFSASGFPPVLGALFLLWLEVIKHWKIQALYLPLMSPLWKSRKKKEMFLTHCDWWRGWSLPINILQMQTVFSLTRVLHHAAQTCQSAGAALAAALAALLPGLFPKWPLKRPFVNPGRMAFIFWNTYWLHPPLCTSPVPIVRWRQRFNIKILARTTRPWGK